jgi:hypothetical protein
MWEDAGNSGFFKRFWGTTWAFNWGDEGTESVDVEDSGVDTPEAAIAVRSSVERSFYFQSRKRNSECWLRHDHDYKKSNAGKTGAYNLERETVMHCNPIVKRHNPEITRL